MNVAGDAVAVGLALPTNAHRQRYERQGVLVEPDAIERAEAQCQALAGWTPTPAAVPPVGLEPTL